MKTHTSHESLRRPRRTLHERETLVNRWERSHESANEFCAKHDISLNSFKRWRAEFDRRRRGTSSTQTTLERVPDGDKGISSFIEVRPPRTASVATDVVPTAAAEIVLVMLDGLRLELRGDAAREAMAQLRTLLGGHS